MKGYGKYIETSMKRVLETFLTIKLDLAQLVYHYNNKDIYHINICIIIIILMICRLLSL